MDVEAAEPWRVQHRLRQDQAVSHDHSHVRAKRRERRLLVGAAVGSAAGVWAWDRWGWSGVCGVGFALTALTGLAAAADLVCARRQPCSV